MVHHQVKFSSVLALNFMCTYAVHILIYSTVFVTCLDSRIIPAIAAMQGAHIWSDEVIRPARPFQ